MYAICLACERRGGRGLSAGWRLVIGWILVPIALLGVIVVLLGLFGP